MAFGLIGLIVGILLILFGGFMVFLFPSYTDFPPAHQTKEFSISGIFIGLLCLLFGFMLVFF